jgi:dephospho-CoA kinase
MLVVGLTGGVASGKSAVAHAFQKQSVPVIETDLIAKSLTTAGQPAHQTILKHFGDAVCQKDGTLDRAKLRHLVFHDTEAKTWLENTLHPDIQACALREYEAISMLDQPYLVVDIPLLTEQSRAAYQIQYIVVVDCEPETQIKRLCARDNINQALAEKMIEQEAYTRAQRLAFADHVIDNNASLDDLAQKIQATHLMLKKLA